MVKFPRRSRLSVCLVACVLAAAASRAPAQAPPTPRVSRADLAAAYLRFEQAFLGSSLDGEATIRVNRAFDALTLSFFTRNYGSAVKQLDVLTSSLLPTGPAAPSPGLDAYRARVSPTVFLVGSGTPTVSIDRIYESDQAPEWKKVSLRLQPAGSGRAVDMPVQWSPEAGAPTVPGASMKTAVKRLKPGRYQIGLARGAAVIVGGTWSVVSRSLNGRAAANAARLARIAAPSPSIAQAVAATIARNGLLTDTPADDSTTRLLFDPEVLAAQVEAEVASLEKGIDPFANRTGDYWRVIKTSARDIPVRVYFPSSAPKHTPIPLVVAFHGAGGDENMFMDAYGGGLIKRLADTRGLLVVSPLTTAFAGTVGGERFDQLVEALGYDYSIDPARIYLVGHSMGGMTVSALVAVRADRIAAAACLNGFSGFGEAVTIIPPTLVTAGELDPIVSPARIEPAFSRAKAAGLPVEYRLLKNYGHTLAVTKLLPDVIEWLTARTR